MVPLTIPPLRERRDCILSLLNLYLDRFSKKYNKKKKITLSGRVADILTMYSYPGNVRELINICERLVVLSRTDRVEYEDLPSSVLASVAEEKSEQGILDQNMTFCEMVDAFEKKVLIRAMDTYGTQARAAQALGLNQSTIARKLKKIKEMRKRVILQLFSRHPSYDLKSTLQSFGESLYK